MKIYGRTAVGLHFGASLDFAVGLDVAAGLDVAPRLSVAVGSDFGICCWVRIYSRFSHVLN